MKTIQTNKLVFLDIDGTLLCRDQTTNDPGLPKKISALSKKGFLFGLNSNRSLVDVLPIYEFFHLNGPLILENGVYFIHENKRTFLLSQRHRFTSRAIKTLLQTFTKQQTIPAQIIVGDSVDFLRSEKATQIPLLLLANKFRKFTGSIHPMRYGERDPKLGAQLYRFLCRYFKEAGIDVKVELSKASGNVIFYPKGASKGRAIKELRTFFPDVAIYMVGDDVSDLETQKQVDAFFAVGNAEPLVKKSADYVATEHYAKGVSEILDVLSTR